LVGEDKLMNAKDASEFRGCPTIQNHRKKNLKWGFMTKNKPPNLENI